MGNCMAVEADGNEFDRKLTFGYYKGVNALEVWEPICCLDEGSISSIHLVRKRPKPIKVNLPEHEDVMSKGGKYSPNELKRILENETVYAMKSIMKEYVENDIYLGEMRAEIEAMSGFDHPNICKVYEAYEKKRHIFLIMGYNRGGNLHMQAPYAEDRAQEIIKQIVSAVLYLHQSNVVHRDLKFENIMFEDGKPDAQINIIDFGLVAKYMQSEKNLLRDRVGTVYTMAPQVLQGVYTSQCDMWSIGVISYMLLSGRKPFNGRTRKEVVNQILRCQYNFDGPEWDHVSGEAQHFVKSLLKMNPANRLNAHEALQSDWLRSRYSGPVVTLKEQHPDIYASIANFSQETRLKKIALVMIAHNSSVEDVSKLRDVFNSYDTYQDGRISIKEFKKAMEGANLTEEEVGTIFAGLDVTANGFIDYTEFVASAISAAGRLETERIDAAFERFDDDQTGYISVKNLTKVLKYEFKDPADIQQIFNEADVNKDGKISQDEFKNLFRIKVKDRMSSIIPTSTNISTNIPAVNTTDSDSSYHTALISENDVVIPGGKSEDLMDARFQYCALSEQLQPKGA